MKILKTLGLLILILVIISAFRLFPNAGIFRTLEPVAYGECEVLPGPVGPEDVTIDQKREIAYISADFRRDYIRFANFGDAPNGEMWSLDLSRSDAQPVKMSHDHEGPFHPHGIALFDEDAYELYVVNHMSAKAHEIAVFTIVSPTELKLRRRITYPELSSPNDIIVLAQDEFLASNDHGYARGSLLEPLEVFLSLPWSYVSYFDGETGHIALSGQRMANGLALSEDKQKLFVAEATRNTLVKYTRGEHGGDWNFLEELHAATAVDNLEWTEEGTLLTGAHPKGFDFLIHTHKPEHPSPSQVVEFNVDTSPMTMKTLFTDTGETVSGSSVAARYGDTLLIGVVFEEQLTRCTPDS